MNIFTIKMIPFFGIVIILSLLFASFSLAQAADTPSASVGSTPKRPNVMIILADDVGMADVPSGYFIGENTFVHMPHLTNLVNNGTTLTDVHSTPKCAPSRYVLLSGNYQHRGELQAGTWDANYKHGNQFRFKQKSLAQVLKAHGYNTAMFGKWHLGGMLNQTICNLSRGMVYQN